MIDVVVGLEGDVAAIGRIADGALTINADTRTSLVAVIANHRQVGTAGQYIQSTESGSRTRATGIASDGNSLGRHSCIGVQVNAISRTASGTGQGDAAKGRTVGHGIPHNAGLDIGQSLATQCDGCHIDAACRTGQITSGKYTRGVEAAIAHAFDHNAFLGAQVLACFQHNCRTGGGQGQIAGTNETTRRRGASRCCPERVVNGDRALHVDGAGIQHGTTGQQVVIDRARVGA